MAMRDHLGAAVDNIAKWGDTDVLPFPIENHLFHDKRETVLDCLEDINSRFEYYFTTFPPIQENVITSVGYLGFRSIAQIDPFWNAYLLGCVIALGPKIEAARIPAEKSVVFSYRYDPDSTNSRSCPSRRGCCSDPCPHRSRTSPTHPAAAADKGDTK